MRHQPGILAARIGDQLVVRATLHDSAAGEDDDLVAVADRRQPVRDDQTGAAAPAQVVVDDPLGAADRARWSPRRESGGWVAHERAGDLQPLPLAAREIPGLLDDGRVVASPALEQVAVDRRVDARLDQPVGRDLSSQSVRLSRTDPSKEADLLIDQRRPS